MPRSLLNFNSYRTLAAAAVLIVFVLFAGLHAGAQKRRRPATTQPQPSASPQTQKKKSITPLRVSETPEGSRVTITSDGALNDYSAYRSGDRFFVVVPQAEAPRMFNTILRGRGFDDVKVEPRGNDVVLSFRLQAGTTARVDQKFNRLEIVFTAPGASRPTTSAGTTPINRTPPLIPSNNANTRNTTTNTGVQANTATTNATTTANDNGTAATSTRGRRGRRGSQGSWSGGNYTYADESSPEVTTTPDESLLTTPTETTSPSPLATPTVAPSATPAEQIAQTQTTTAPPTPPTAIKTTSNQPAPGSSSLGATLKQNWLLLLLGALVLLIIGWVLTARSRSGRDAEATAIATQEKSTLKDSPATKADTKSLDAVAVAAVPVAAAIQTTKEERESASVPEVAPVPVVAESREIEPVASVDVERAGSEVNNVLAGERYDEAVIGASDTGTRQIIAAGLLAALAGRSAGRRERAREAFIKHGYFDETTRALRTSDAPAERASAARSLGLARDRAATPHLVAALEDKSPEVRRAAVESLADMGDPEALAPLQALLEREKDRKVPRGLMRRAIEASTPATVETPAAEAVAAPALAEETPTAEAAPVSAEAAAPTVEEAPGVEAAEAAPTTTETSSIITAEAPSVETSVQPEALDTVPEPATAEVASPTTTADVSPTEGASGLGTLAAVTPIIAVGGALAAHEIAARKRAEKEEAARQRDEEKAARQRAEEERRRAEEEAARLRAEEEERQRVEAEAARLRAEEEARQRAEEEAARLRAEEEARRQSEEEARRRAEEEEARQRAEEEVRRQAEEEARKKAEEEAARQRAEEAARLQAEEEERQRAAEEARLRAEEEARQRAEEERRRAEEARLRAEEEARRQAEEEARQHVEAEAARQRAEEEARARAEEERQRAEEERLRAEEAQRRAEQEAARQREEAEAARRLAEEEAERERAKADLARLRAEAEATRLRTEAELGQRQVIQPDVAASLSGTQDAAPTEAASLEVIPEPVIERNDGSAAGWIEVDISEPEIVRHATPIKQTPATPVQEEIAFAEVTPSPVVAEPVMESVAPEVVEQPAAAESYTKEIDRAVVDKGIAPVGEDLSTVPSAILKRLSSEDATERAGAVADLGRLGGDDSFREISAAFDDPAPEVRNAAARALYNMQADRAASFTRALREAPPERRRQIGAALASSGLATEAIGHLMGESREKTYDAFSLLFLMSKAGEVQPLMRAIEDHPNNEVRLAVVKLLALSGQQEILPAFRRLAVRGSLPTEVRSAVMEAIYQISSQSSPDTSSAA